ncbi:MAG: hypothetical protein ACPIOQ_25715 [Promethearchaeia archaeon]
MPARDCRAERGLVLTDLQREEWEGEGAGQVAALKFSTSSEGEQRRGEHRLRKQRECRSKGAAPDHTTEGAPAGRRMPVVQGVRRREHLRAQAAKERVQGVRRGEHLPELLAKERVQGVRSTT